MNQEQTQKIKRNKFLNLFTGLIVGMFVCVTGYLIYNLLKLNNVENLIRYIVVGVLFLISIITIIKYIKLKKQSKKSKYFILIIVLLIIGIGEFFISSLIDKGVSTIDKMNKNYVTYSSSLIAMKDGNYNKLSKIKNAKIGIISDKKDTEGYVLAQNIIKKDKIAKDQLVEYDDYVSMLSDLYSDEVNAIFISSSYEDKFASVEKYEKIGSEVVELDKYSKLMKKVTDKNTSTNTKKVTEPFTMLLLGVDSPTEDISKASGLGDSIMLITFNPNTLNATVFSIPRDTFVPITCYRNARSKITHAASGGDSCMISTIENFTGINIDYYAKVNFQGLIKLVDALGGIDVDVPYKFCESNSVRSLNSSDLIYVEKGWQHLNGEQALALSRNRKTVSECGKEWNKGTRNDFVRGQNQQLVVRGIMNKLKAIKSINQLYSVLDTISISLDTNLTRDQILDFYNVFKKVLVNSGTLSDSNDVISMQKTYLNGSGGLIYDNIMNMKLYEFVPSSQSLNAIIKAMKVNLELIEEDYDTSFSFTIDEPYESKIIGADLYGGVTKYPDPTSDTKIDSSSKTCAEGEELGADKTTCVCKYGYTRKNGVCEKKETSSDSDTKTDENKKVSVCVSENGGYYWYDSNGDKNPTKYKDSTCSTAATDTSTSTDTKKDDTSKDQNKDNTTDDKKDSGTTIPTTEPSNETKNEPESGND